MVKGMSTVVSARLTADEQTLLEVLDFNFSEFLHQILDNLAMVSEPEDVKEALIKFDNRQCLERKLFKATLENHYKNQIVGGIRFSKRQKAIREIHKALEAVLGPPPWDSITYRERINDHHIKTLADVKLSQEELEGYSKIRGFITTNQLDTTEYLPTSTHNIKDESPTKAKKGARDTIERHLRNIIQSTPKDEIDNVLEDLLSNPSWNSMATKADVDLKDLYSELKTQGSGVRQ